MSLQDLMPELLADINNSVSGRNISTRLHRIYEHSIIPEVKDSMQAELSEKSFERSKRRIPDVNTVRQVTNKLSKVYDKDAIRKSKLDADQNLIEYYEKVACLDQKMRTANVLLELLRGFAIEPYMASHGPAIRVLAPHQFRPYSDDANDPTRMTVFTKFMPDTYEEVVEHGIKTRKSIRNFRSYSDREIMDWNSEGRIKSVIDNPVKRNPFVYGNPSEFELTPEPQLEDIETALVIPKAYADLFYALKYTCHSVTVAIDCEIPSGATWAPDAFFEAKTDADAADAGKRGSIETIKPTADIEKALALITDTAASILESRGIKAPGRGQYVERPNAAAAMIEDADASSYVKKRCGFFQSIEAELWDLLAVLHNQLWIRQAQVKNKSRFSESLEVEVQFGEIKPVEIRSELVARLKLQIDAGLMTPMQALEELYPNLTRKQLEERLKQVQEHGILSASPKLPDGKPAPGDRAGDNKDNPGANEERPES